MATKRIELVDSGVNFNPENHTYELNGTYLSGITELLQRQLFPNEYTNIPKAILQQAAAYGSSVHQSCEDFDSQWINDGTQEVQDYIELCTTHNLTHEASEYTVTDYTNYASNIDKVFRISSNTFDLADLKTYGKMTPENWRRHGGNCPFMPIYSSFRTRKRRQGNYSSFTFGTSKRKTGVLTIYHNSSRSSESRPKSARNYWKPTLEASNSKAHIQSHRKSAPKNNVSGN